MNKAILFDLDGTLWDSSEAVAASWNEMIRTFPDFHEEMSAAQMRSYMGMPMDEIAYAYFSTVSKERALEFLKVCMANENAYILKHGGRLFDGLEDVLKRLKEKYFLAIVSNCQNGYIEAFLSYYKLWDYFRDRECYEHTGLQKSDNIRLVIERNQLSDVIYIGDTMGDFSETMKAAELLNCQQPPVRLQFLHAAYGFGSVPEKTASVTEPGMLAETVAELFSGWH